MKNQNHQNIIIPIREGSVQ